MPEHKITTAAEIYAHYQENIGQFETENAKQLRELLNLDSNNSSSLFHHLMPWDECHSITFFLERKTLYTRISSILSNLLTDLPISEKRNEIYAVYCLWASHASLVSIYHDAVCNLMDVKTGAPLFIYRSNETPLKAIDMQSEKAVEHGHLTQSTPSKSKNHNKHKKEKIKKAFSAGIKALNEKNYQDAQIHFERTLELNPEHCQAYYYLIDALRKQGSYDEALELCEILSLGLEAKQQNNLPNQPNEEDEINSLCVYYHTAAIQRGKGEQTNYFEVFTKIFNLFKENPNTYGGNRLFLDMVLQSILNLLEINALEITLLKIKIETSRQENNLAALKQNLQAAVTKSTYSLNMLETTTQSELMMLEDSYLIYFHLAQNPQTQKNLLKTKTAYQACLEKIKQFTHISNDEIFLLAESIVSGMNIFIHDTKTREKPYTPIEFILLKACEDFYREGFKRLIDAKNESDCKALLYEETTCLDKDLVSRYRTIVQCLDCANKHNMDFAYDQVNTLAQNAETVSHDGYSNSVVATFSSPIKAIDTYKKCKVIVETYLDQFILCESEPPAVLYFRALPIDQIEGLIEEREFAISFHQHLCNVIDTYSPLVSNRLCVDGVEYFEKGSYEKALQSFEQSLHYNPENSEAQTYLNTIASLRSESLHAYSTNGVGLFGASKPAIVESEKVACTTPD